MMKTIMNCETKKNTTMKTLYTNIKTLAALLIAGAAMTACSSDDTIVEEPITKTTAPNTFSMTITATKGDMVTRALTPSGTGIVASWAENEEVKVYNVTKGAYLEGELVAQGTGATTTLKGQLTGSVDAGDDLKLEFCSNDYSQQDGTLSSIASNCDYSTATITVGSAVNGVITTNLDEVEFSKHQSITKFTIYDKTANAVFSPTTFQVDIMNGSTLIDSYSIDIPDATYTTNEAEGVIYLALPNASSLSSTPNKLVFTATDSESSNYTYTKEGDYPFADNTYNKINIKMTKAARVVDLSTITNAYQAQNGETLTGTLGSAVRISIAPGATVTLKDVSINSAGTGVGRFAGITCEGDAKIILEGVNTVNGFNEEGGQDHYNPGLFVPSGYTLTIDGEGQLTAEGKGGAAGIGSSSRYDGADCGNIIINGGTIIATGGNYGTNLGGGAGIGSSYDHSCGTITINGGNVTATGGYDSAGIGKYTSTSCGAITINGGTVTAVSGSNKNAPSISGSSITINENVNEITMIIHSDVWNSSAFLSGGTVMIDGQTIAANRQARIFNNAQYYTPLTHFDSNYVYNSSPKVGTWTLTHK